MRLGSPLRAQVRELGHCSHLRGAHTGGLHLGYVLAKGEAEGLQVA
jgi:hypothetical protein